MKRRPMHAGFSVVEVLVAVALLTVAVAGLVQGLATAMRSSKDSELLTIAAHLAAGQLELLRADGWVREGVSEGSGLGKLSAYHWTQTITPSSLEGLYEVSVSVRHESSQASIYDLRSMLYDPPLGTTTNRTERGGVRGARERARRDRR